MTRRTFLKALGAAAASMGSNSVPGRLLDAATKGRLPIIVDYVDEPSSSMDAIYTFDDGAKVFSSLGDRGYRWDLLILPNGQRLRFKDVSADPESWNESDRLILPEEIYLEIKRKGRTLTIDDRDKLRAENGITRDRLPHVDMSAVANAWGDEDISYSAVARKMVNKAHRDWTDEDMISWYQHYGAGGSGIGLGSPEKARAELEKMKQENAQYDREEEEYINKHGRYDDNPTNFELHDPYESKRAIR